MHEITNRLFMNLVDFKDGKQVWRLKYEKIKNLPFVQFNKKLQGALSIFHIRK